MTTTIRDSSQAITLPDLALLPPVVEAARFAGARLLLISAEV